MIPLRSSGVCAANGLIYILGGVYIDDDQNKSDNIFVFNPALDTVLTIGKLPKPRSAFSIACLNNTIYVISGLTSKENIGSIDETSVIAYNIKEKRWDSLPDISSPRWPEASAVVYNGKILIVGGGFNDEGILNIDIFDPEKNQWIKGPALAKPRAYHMSAVVGDTLYVIGGADPFAETNLNQYYDDIEIIPLARYSK